MSKPIGAILLVIGGILIFYGVHAADSMASEVSEFVEGTPSDKSIWLLISGVVLVVVGLFGLATRQGRSAV